MNCVVVVGVEVPGDSVGACVVALLGEFLSEGQDELDDLVAKLCGAGVWAFGSGVEGSFAFFFVAGDEF